MKVSIVDIEAHLKTAGHPDADFAGHRLIDRLQEHLDDGFDPDNIFNTPYGSYAVGLKASVLRYSRFEYSETAGDAYLEIDLQPAYDIADMVVYYLDSRIWPVRVVFDIFNILQQILYARGLTKAGSFVDIFRTRHLPELMDGLELVRPHEKRYVSRFASRGQERDALREHLVAFQIFHELSHLIGSRDRKIQNAGEPLVDLDEELKCDDFACQEVISFYDEEGAGDFFRVAQISIFLLMLIWTLAASYRCLQSEAKRTRIFDDLLRRAHAATLLIDRRFHLSRPPDMRADIVAVRYFPMFTEILALISVFAKKGCAKTPDLFEFIEDDYERIGRLLWEVNGEEAPAVEQAGPQREWEKIWESEAQHAERRMRTMEKLWQQHRSRQRSRPVWSYTPEIPEE